MAMKYADRAFISANGALLSDVQSCTLRQNFNARVVPSMTTDGFNRGYVEGNRDIDINLVLAVENLLSRPKLDQIDFENNDVQLTFVAGSDQFIAAGLFRKDVEDAAPGVGEEVKATFNFGALKVTDAVGNSVLFDIGL